MEKIVDKLMIVLFIFMVASVAYFIFRFSVDNYKQNLKGSYVISVEPTPSPINIPLDKN